MDPVASGSGSIPKSKPVRASTSTKNRGRSPSPFRSSNDTTLEEFMPEFWQHTLDNAEKSEDDFKRQALPLARIKKVAKMDPDVQMISSEVTILFEKACQIFIQELTARAHLASLQSKRRTLARTDVAAALTKSDSFDFLIDIVPREERAAASGSNSNSNASASTSHSKNASSNGAGAAGKRPSRSRKSSQKARQQEISTPVAAQEGEGDQNGQIGGEGGYEMSYQAPQAQSGELSFEGLEEFEQVVQQEREGVTESQPRGQPIEYQQVYSNHYPPSGPQQQARYGQGGAGETSELSPGDGAFEGWDGLEMAPIDPNQFDSNPASNGSIPQWNGQYDYNAQQVSSNEQQMAMDEHGETVDARGIH
ncbi:hypothetical protein JCM5353_006246 [Sporobolomyces roseus]